MECMDDRKYRLTASCYSSINHANISAGYPLFSVTYVGILLEIFVVCFCQILLIK